MTIKLSEARQLCTKPELELVVAASPKALSEITPASLQRKIDRTRKLRDKYTALAQEQKRKQKATKASRGLADAGARTLRKVELFAELIEKFSKRKTTLEERKRKEQEAAARKKEKAQKAAAKKAAPKKTAKKAAVRKSIKNPTKKATTKKSAKSAAKAKVKSLLTKKPGKTATKTARRESSVNPGGQSGTKAKATKIAQRTRSKAINAHISSSGKRAQARRDSKGR